MLQWVLLTALAHMTSTGCTYFYQESINEKKKRYLQGWFLAQFPSGIRAATGWRYIPIFEVEFKPVEFILLDFSGDIFPNGKTVSL